MTRPSLRLSRAPVALLGLTAAALCALSAACSSDAPAAAVSDVVGLPDAGADPGSADTGAADAGAPDAVALDVDLTQQGSVRYDLAAARDDDFFAFPYPSDLRRHPDGRPDLASFPRDRTDVELLGWALEAVEAEMVGFSPLSSAYFVFDVDLDPGTLPTDAAASLAPEASVFMVDVTPGSPSYGQRAPVTVAWHGPGGGYWAPRTLAVHPLYGVPPRAGATWAVVVTTGVTTADGAPLTPPAAVNQAPALLDQAAPPEIALGLRPLVEAAPDLGAGGLEWQDVLVATVYTTADPAADLRSLADWMRTELPAPTVTGPTWVEDGPGYAVYEGTFTSAEFFTGEAPYATFGAGLMTLKPDGTPIQVTPVTLRYCLTVPTVPTDPAGQAAMPAAGWPLVLYSHGLGEDYRGFLRVAAEPMAARGAAVLGLDPPLQGARNPTGQDDRSLIIDLSINNILAGREILRQGVLDEVQAGRLVAGGLSVAASEAPDGVEARFDPTRVAFMGHSEGAQIGALLLPLAPEIGGAVLSEGGGGAAITMIELNLDGIDIASLVALGLGIDDSVEALELGHPVVSAVIQPLLDPADPLHVARELFREPKTGAGHDLVMLEGFNDPLTPPPAIEALAAAAQLPIAEPVARAIDALTLQGVPSSPLPASDNLPGPAGATFTGGLLQFPNLGHYIVYFNEPARTRMFDFLASSLAGEAVVGP